MKTSVRWLLFEYQSLEIVIWSKPFETKKLAEKARQKYPDRMRRKWDRRGSRAMNLRGFS